ncbi:MAG: Maf family protein [Anaerolineales bacterium]
MKRLILASNSPRRKELFSLFGWPFEVIPADIDEKRLPKESPMDYVRRLAREKAQEVANQCQGLIIAADTIVVDGDELLGKPTDQQDAARMLRQMCGRTHQVYTGFSILDIPTGKFYEDICRTDVHMRNYSEEDIRSYIATGDPMDKAGAYAIQHADFHPVERLTGCYASVMGLPLCQLAIGLKKFGLMIPPDLPDRCQALLGVHCPDFDDVLGGD